MPESESQRSHQQSSQFSCSCLQPWLQPSPEKEFLKRAQNEQPNRNSQRDLETPLWRKLLIPAEYNIGINTPAYSRRYSPEKCLSQIALRKSDGRPIANTLRPEEGKSDSIQNKNQKQGRNEAGGKAKGTKTDIGKPKDNRISPRLDSESTIIDCHSGSFQIAKGRTIARADIL
jgi:hypothetical protein